MYFKQIVREDLGCASYLVGSTVEGVAAVVDPRLDMVDEICSLLNQQGLRLTHIVETHLHADHVSGRARMARATGAKVSIHEAADVAYRHEDLRAAMQLELGELVLKVLPTPGHRPEHIALVGIDRSRSEEPWFVLTGDALFVGDVGRPDLAVPAKPGSRALYHSLFDELLQLPDWVEVYPAHLAGSLCGRITSRKTSSTIGYERWSNPALIPRSATAFMRDVTAALPPQPPNMHTILERNRAAELPSTPEPVPLDVIDVARRLEGNAAVLDVRSPADFGAGHVPGAINVFLDGGQFGTRVGFVTPPDSELLLVLASEGDITRVREALAVVGYDVAGYLAGGMEAWRTAGADIATVPQVSPDDLVMQRAIHAPVTILDVREDSEWASGHIPQAVHVPFHQVKQNLDRLPDGRLAVVCGSGVRSSIATSLLQRAGRMDVQNVAGGMTAWKNGSHPTTLDDD
jgi:glyoxylase-like metal-dependent hydrolase (beta-lactamase superfamily II)/rhodanese-related sulfurtransferase